MRLVREWLRRSRKFSAFCNRKPAREAKTEGRLLLYNVSMSQSKTVRLTETVKAAG